MIKSFIFVFIFLLFQNLLLAIDELSNPIILTPQEQNYIKQHPVIIAHNEKNWAPFNFNEKDVPKGYSIDYMNLLASKVGLKVEYLSGYSWDEYMNFLQTPKLDVIINIAQNPEREKTIAFTNTYISVKNAIYSHKNKRKFYSLEELNGYTIAMPKGFFMQKYIKTNYPFINQVLTDDLVGSMQLLSLGKVDAVIGKKIVVDRIIEEYLISNIVVTNYINDENTISHVKIGAAKNDQILIDILKKAQRKVTDDEISHLKTKWFKVGTMIEEKAITNLEDSEKEYLKQKKAITYCIDPNWMPLEKIENHQHIGLSNDFIKLLEKNLNTPFKLVETSTWNESIENIKNKKCDILSLAVLTPKRSQYLDSTTTIISSKIVVATKKNTLYVQNIGNNLDKKFAIVKGYSINEILKEKYPELKVVSVNNIDEGLELVANGKVFGYIDNPIVLMYAIKNNYLGQLSITGTLDEKADFSILTRSEDKVLNNIINKAFSNISLEDRSIIKNKWLTYEQAYLLDYKYIYLIIIFFSIIILVLLYNLYKYYKFKKLRVAHLYQQTKLIAMGEMLANISHQWKQPLSELNSIVMNIDLDYQKNNLDSKTLDKHLTHIENLTKYMSDTIMDFNTFLSSNKTKNKFNLFTKLNEIINLFEITFKDTNIKFILDIDEKINIINFEGEFKQIILVMIINAKDAIKQNNIENGLIKISANYINDKVRIKIYDNGGGIPPKILNRIFEPYFSTKSKSSSLGLGLYMVYQLINFSMKGTIEVKNINEGAEFIITLPFDISNNSLS